MSSPVPSKTARAEAVARRKAMSPAEISRESDLVANRFISLAAKAPWRGAGVAIYHALPTELSLRALETWLVRQGARVHYPRVSDRDQALLEFVEADEGTAWESGPYGIQEPASHHPPVAPSALDVVFVPGAAFGLSGERVGMGMGYYDRFLSSVPQALRIALGFEFQLYPALEQNPWDQPLHWILTATREYRSPRAEAWITAN